MGFRRLFLKLGMVEAKISKLIRTNLTMRNQFGFRNMALIFYKLIRIQRMKAENSSDI